MLNSKNNDWHKVYIGIAPSDIDLNEGYNYKRCGWHFNFYWSALWSGPSHSYEGKKYGPKKWDKISVHTGDIVGVVMDTAKGELSFAMNGVNLGVAFDGIPLDKPLVPCVLLRYKYDSVELII